MIRSGFMLCAGFGTRFQPQSNFLPKPAMPFFNLPLALYPAGLLKKIGTEEIFYNSHHLAPVLEKFLHPYLGNCAVREDPILDSAGGILNAKKHFSKSENFWVINGDSFIATDDFEQIKEHAQLHVQEERLATFFCIPRKNSIKSGLLANSQGELIEISSAEEAQHFIGLYLLNERIFEHIKKQPSHIFKDVILPLTKKEKIHVALLDNKTRWHETGSEETFIQAHIEETNDIFNKTEDSFVIKIHELWNSNYKQDLYHFLNTKVWGVDAHGHPHSFFNCVPKNFQGNPKLLQNCIVATDNKLPDSNFKNQVLVDASQWN